MTIAADFKQALEPAEYELERGGAVVKLRKVGLMDLILQGAIPDQLTGIAAQIASTTLAKQMTAEELQRYGALVDAVFCAACVEPKIGEDVEARDIPFAWKVKVFNWANASVGVLRPFRAEPARNVEDLQSGEDVWKVAG